ncbi:MAG: hypothetical protein LBC68_05265 [Prevotellaceae bacterium]|jgi:tetratricopeptide (TPR) repeat protein|nr:hypothetical protein [Prevotellaceae bacterium]
MKIHSLHIIVTFLLSCFCLISYSQSTQKGKVLLQNSGRKTLPGVQIIAFGAQPADTDNDGVFALNFSKAAFGDLTPLKDAYKKGYELVNRTELDKWILSSEKDMIVVMCPAGYIRQAREKYYDIGNSVYIKRYEQTLQEIESQKENNKLNEQEYAGKLEIAYNELNNALGHLRDYSEIFARINKDDLSELENRAFQLLENGKLDEAIRLYENEKLLDKLSQQIKIKETAMQEMNDMIASLRRYADICMFAGGKENLDKAAQIYESLATANPGDYQSQFDYGKFLRNTIKYDEAIVWLQKALKCTDNKILIAQTQRETGEVYNLNRDYVNAINILEKSAEIFKTEAKSSPQYYIDAAQSICNITDAYFYQEKYSDAISLLNTAQKYLDKGKDNSGFYLEVDAHITHNLAGHTFWRYLKNFKADTTDLNYYFEESIRKVQSLMQIDSAKYSIFYISSIHNFVSYNVLTNNFPIMKKYNILEIDICRDLYNKNPYQGAVQLSDAYSSLASVYKKSEEYEKAKKEELFAYELRKELAKNNPNAFLQKLCNSINELGNLTGEKLHNYDEGRNYLQESIRLGEQLYETDKSANFLTLFSNYFDMGDLLLTARKNGIIMAESPDIYYSKAENLIQQNSEMDNINLLLTLWNRFADYYEQTDSIKYGVYLDKTESFIVNDIDMKSRLYYFINEADKADSIGNRIKADVYYKKMGETLELAILQGEKFDKDVIIEYIWKTGDYFWNRKNIDYAIKNYELLIKYNKKPVEEMAVIQLEVFLKLRNLYELTGNLSKVNVIDHDMDELFNHFAKKTLGVNLKKASVQELLLYGETFEDDSETLLFAILFYNKAINILKLGIDIIEDNEYHQMILKQIDYLKQLEKQFYEQIK